VQITMKTLAAGPERTLETGRTYDVPGEVPRDVADDLVAGGYAVPVGGPAKPAAKTPKTPAPPKGEDVPGSLDGKTVEQLLAYAVENELDLGGATKKADILAAIKAAETGGD
jgi:hypothetical protein